MKNKSKFWISKEKASKRLITVKLAFCWHFKNVATLSLKKERKILTLLEQANPIPRAAKISSTAGEELHFTV
jgi:hypothetical protein